MNATPTFQELWALIDGLDEDFHDWQAVRRLKVVGHTLAKGIEDES